MEIEEELLHLGVTMLKCFLAAQLEGEFRSLQQTVCFLVIAGAQQVNVFLIECLQTEQPLFQGQTGPWDAGSIVAFDGFSLGLERIVLIALELCHQFIAVLHPCSQHTQYAADGSCLGW